MPHCPGVSGNLGLQKQVYAYEDIYKVQSLLSLLASRLNDPDWTRRDFCRAGFGIECSELAGKWKSEQAQIMFSSRTDRERGIVAAMVRLYCHDLHASKRELCADCGALASYADEKLLQCPFQEEKTTCAKCPVHCYQPEMRAKVKAVMRYAGPRMLRRHPVMAIIHLIHGFRK
jgi:hypothetical protein